MNSDRPLGIDCLGVFGLPPVPFVELAAELGCAFITVGVAVSRNPERYPRYSFEDAQTRREMKAALRDRGITVKVGEGFFFMPGLRAGNFAAHLDAMADIGAQTINMVSLNGDFGRSLDEFAMLAEMAAERGLSSSVEFVAGQAIGTLDDAVKAIRHVGRADCKLVVDLLHLTRSGGDAASLARIDAALIGYVQLCDCRYETTDYLYEALYERLSPGDGELPLRELLAALPRAIAVGVEVPQLRLAESGLGPAGRLMPCLQAARALLAQLDASGVRIGA